MRGVAMMLVMMQHFLVGNAYVVVAILDCHMPFFFFLSGYMLYLARSVEKSTLGQYTSKRFQRLIVPYFWFELLVLLLSCMAVPLVHNQVTCVGVFKSIVLCLHDKTMFESICRPLWFFPCMFFSNIFVYLAIKYLPALWQRMSFIAMMFALSWGMPKLLMSCGLGLRLPFTLDISLMAAVFIMSAYVAGPFIKALWSMKSRLNMFLLSLLFAVLYAGCCYFNDSYILMFDHKYGNYFLAYAGAAFSFLALSMWCKLYCSLNLHKGESFFVWLGINSLLLFPLHIILGNLLFFALKQMPGIQTHLVCFTIVVLVCIPAVNGIQYFLSRKKVANGVA